MKKNLLLLLLSVFCLLPSMAQTVRVLPAENLYMEKGQLHRGVILGELVPKAKFSSFCPYWQIDSVQIYGQLFDPKTLEPLPYVTVYAVHRDNDYIVDSVVNNPSEWSVHFVSPASQHRLFALHTPGYVPVILEYQPPVMPEITKVSQLEYLKLDRSFQQTFQQQAFDSNEYRQWVEAVLDEQERIWLDNGDLYLEAGRFMPMGMPAVRIAAPIDDLRRFYLNNMRYGTSIHADFAYALSPEGYFVGQVQYAGDLRVVWHIARIDGYEQIDLPPIVFDTPPGHADEFRWAPGGWLYFKRGDEYFKLHVDIPVTQNCRMQDIEISEEEFFKVMKSAEQKENIMSHDRTPDATDTAILSQWAGIDLLSFDLISEECGYVSYEPGYECLEIAVGDYCCTRLKGDTVDMEACMMALSASSPRYFAGVNMEWGAGDVEVPGYIYIYPLSSDNRHVGTPFIYQTTPEWFPQGRHYFWAADGWFYVEGYDRKSDRPVYHKLHLPQP